MFAAVTARRDGFTYCPAVVAVYVVTDAAALEDTGAAATLDCGLLELFVLLIWAEEDEDDEEDVCASDWVNAASDK